MHSGPMNRTTLLLLSLLCLPGAALAGSFDSKDLGGCSLPVLSGAKLANGASPALEEGNLFYVAGGKQQWWFWVAGPGTEMTPGQLAGFAEGMAKGGAWFDHENATWEEVDGTKAARLSFKLSADQPVAGRLLAWVHPQSNRVFWTGLTPPWNSKGVSSVSAAALDALLTEAAGMVDCSAAGAVDRGLAMFDPPPRTYAINDTDPPRLYYLKPGHTMTLWRGRAASDGSETSCVARAAAEWAKFEGPLEFSRTGEATAAVDDYPGAGAGPRCDVSQPVTGFTDQEGSSVRYVRYACPGADGEWVEAIELTNDSVGAPESRQDLLSAVCGSELPPPPEPEEEPTPEQKREQWVPGG